MLLAVSGITIATEPISSLTILKVLSLHENDIRICNKHTKNTYFTNSVEAHPEEHGRRGKERAGDTPGGVDQEDRRQGDSVQD